MSRTNGGGRAVGREYQRRYNVREAAEHLGISTEAVRMRVKRGTLEAEKGEDGRTYVRLDADPTQTEQPYQQPDHGQSEELVEALRSQVDDLREQLRAERDANRENRRLLAAALERIPELEAGAAGEEPRQPSQTAAHSAASDEPDVTPGSQQTEAQSGAQRPRRWWERLLGR